MLRDTSSSLKYQTYRVLPCDFCLRSHSSDIQFWNWASRVTCPQRGQMYTRQESLSLGIVPHRTQTNPKEVKRTNVLTCRSWKNISSPITNRGVAALFFWQLIKYLVSVYKQWPPLKTNATDPGTSQQPCMLFPGIWKTYYPSVLDSFLVIESNSRKRGFILAQSLGYTPSYCGSPRAGLWRGRCFCTCSQDTAVNAYCLWWFEYARPQGMALLGGVALLE